MSMQVFLTSGISKSIDSFLIANVQVHLSAVFVGCHILNASENRKRYKEAWRPVTMSVEINQDVFSGEIQF